MKYHFNKAEVQEVWLEDTSSGQDLYSDLTFFFILMNQPLMSFHCFCSLLITAECLCTLPPEIIIVISLSL